MQNIKLTLENYFDKDISDFINGHLNENNVYLKITKERISKRGDYRPPQFGEAHKITLNFDKNKYRMLITWIHEYAHLLNWIENKNTVNPHGVEWKEKFRFVLLDAMSKNLFPSSIDKELFMQFLNKENFTGQANTSLETELHKYDQNYNLILNDIPKGTKFTLKNGMMFVKGEKLRKRYQCKELISGKNYTVHGFAEIQILD
jgi:small nuclear ribonucleoprotein (snRNP)-like protein